MRTLLGILRRGLKILGWMGCGLSALLFVATVVLWVRSVGHSEGWTFRRFEPRPDWRVPDLPAKGIGHSWSAGAIHGRLWLGSGTWAPLPEFQPQAVYRRDRISAADAKQRFDTFFQPGERPWWGGTARSWRVAGAGFCRGQSTVDSRIGRPFTEDFTLAVPFWMLTVLFALWPGLVAGRRVLRWRRNRLRRKRLGEGLCLHCGYDLRATPDPCGPLLPRCPECGREAGEGRQGDSAEKQGDKVTKGQGEEGAREVIGGGG